MPRIIAFTGISKTGKTDLAYHVIIRAREYGINPKEFTFKKYAAKTYCDYKGIGMETLVVNQLEDFYKSEIQEFTEGFSKDFFFNMMMADIYPTDFVVIDDVRLLEQHFLPLINAGASIYRMESNDSFRQQRKWDSERFEYKYELDISLDTFRFLGGMDDIVNNINSSAFLEKKVDELIRRHFVLPVLEKSM